MVTNQTVNKYGTTRANMSMVMEEGVVMHCKSVMSNLLTVLVLLFEPSTDIAKPKFYLEAYLYIRQPPITVTSRNPVISHSLYSFFFFSIMMRYNSRSH